MPKPIFLDLFNHYQQSQTTLVRCLRIERCDGKVIALTEHDEDLIIEGVTYQSAVGYTPTAIARQGKGTVNTVDLEGILNIAGVSREEITAGCFDGARIFVFEVNYEDVSQGILPLITGFWGACQLQDYHYVTEFNSLSQVLQHTVGELYSTTCRAQLGDKRCGVALDQFTFEGLVTSVTSPHEFIAKGFAQPNDYFQYGLITWQEGKNSNLSMEIQSFQRAENPNNEEIPNGIFRLVQPMPYAINVGDIFFVTTGCNKSLTLCRERFNNAVNFRGEPFIPGIDQMLRTP